MGKRINILLRVLAATAALVMWSCVENNDTSSISFDGYYLGEISFTAEGNSNTRQTRTVTLLIDNNDVTLMHIPADFVIAAYSDKMPVLDGISADEPSLTENNYPISIKSISVVDNLLHASVDTPPMSIFLGSLNFTLQPQTDIIYDFDNGGVLKFGLKLSKIEYLKETLTVNGLFTVDALKQSLSQSAALGNDN